MLGVKTNIAQAISAVATAGLIAVSNVAIAAEKPLGQPNTYLAFDVTYSDDRPKPTWLALRRTNINRARQNSLLHVRVTDRIVALVPGEYVISHVDDRITFSRGSGRYFHESRPFVVTEGVINYLGDLEIRKKGRGFYLALREGSKLLEELCLSQPELFAASPVKIIGANSSSLVDCG